MSKRNSKLKQFLADKRGALALNMGLAAIPVMMTIGAATDYSRLLTADASLQATADAVALDAASAYSMGKTTNALLTARAQEFIWLNPPAGIDVGNVTVSATVGENSDRVKITMTTDVPVIFGHFLGDVASKNLEANSTAMVPIFSNWYKGEIALVLDYSSSMTDTVGGVVKWQSVRTEAKKLVSHLSQNGTNDDVKFAVVPFSGAVRFQNSDNYVTSAQINGTTGVDNNSPAGRCVIDRKYPYNRDASTPTTDNLTKFTAAPTSINCSNYRTAKHWVRDLSLNHSATLTALEDLRTVVGTHIALGAEVGYHVLTGNAPFTTAVPTGTADTLKAVIIFTDGEQTSSGYGSGQVASVNNANSNLEQLCTNMKANGIRVFTVSFDLPDSSSSSETRLKNCSGPSNLDPVRTAAEIAADPYPYYYNTETNEQLAQAFGRIRNQLARNIYITE